MTAGAIFVPDGFVHSKIGKNIFRKEIYMKTIVITGATSGIGLETARILCRLGFRVLGVGHSEKNCELAKADLLSGDPGAQITYFAADLMQQHEVLRAADELTSYINEKCGGELYALINNAGCARNWYMTTDEGYEQQFALNYLAGFLLTHELLPFLLKSGGRVMMTGSESHKGIKVHWNDVMLRRGYNPLTAYKQSKLCDILFAKGLNDRYSEDGLHAYVLDPGLVHTEISQSNIEIFKNKLNYYVKFRLIFLPYPDKINRGSGDFSGKTVIPFCTSGMSGPGETDARLRPSCSKDTAWRPAKRFPGRTGAAELKKWVEGLDL